MDPDQFRRFTRIFEDRGMQEWLRNLQRPETQRWMTALQSSGIQSWMKDLPRPEMERHLLNFQRPEMQGFLEHVQRPDVLKHMKEIWDFRNVMKHELPITGYRLPPAVFRPAIDPNLNMGQAAAEAAKSAQAMQLGSATTNLAKSLRLDLPTDALASAQYAALRHTLENPAWLETVRELARSPLAEIQARYVETMRDATQLLSDETIQRLVELAESANLIEEGMDAAEDSDSPLEAVVTSEAVEYMGLDASNVVDTLVPVLQWAILVFSIALVMTFSAPNYKEYKQPLTETLVSRPHHGSPTTREQPTVREQQA